MINVELFSCAGGMAKGFSLAGIEFDLAFDFAKVNCDSYEKNIGHRPICMDVRDLLRMVKLGTQLPPIRLLVADPPCTPWSRSGKRLGTEDERDMIENTCELIALLRPQVYLIGNVPGLDDAVNWHVVQRVIGGLAQHGYCVVDFIALDAADYGVPQHRVRPFWFGHLAGPCIRWPKPTHADPSTLGTVPMFAGEALAPWRTCRDALGHLSLEQLGRPVHLRGKWANGDGDNHRPSEADEPAKTIARNTHSDGYVLHVEPHHPPSMIDEPAMTVRAGCGGGANRALQLSGDGFRRRNRKHPPSQPSQPSHTIGAVARGNGASLLEWPWNRPSTTVHSDPRIAPPGHHEEALYANVSQPNAVVLSEVAATILQGFPEDWHFAGDTAKERWSQRGQAMPPPLALAVATSVKEQLDATQRAQLCDCGHIADAHQWGACIDCSCASFFLRGEAP